MTNDTHLLIRATLRHTNHPTTDVPLVDEFDALVADAVRFRAIRLFVCEPDEAVRQRMFEAVDALMEKIDAGREGAAPTRAEFDSVMDKVIVAANGARHANR
jgi:hypothetical protein